MSINYHQIHSVTCQCQMKQGRDGPRATWRMHTSAGFTGLSVGPLAGAGAPWVWSMKGKSQQNKGCMGWGGHVGLVWASRERQLELLSRILPLYKRAAQTSMYAKHMGVCSKCSLHCSKPGSQGMAVMGAQATPSLRQGFRHPNPNTGRTKNTDSFLILSEEHPEHQDINIHWRNEWITPCENFKCHRQNRTELRIRTTKGLHPGSATNHTGRHRNSQQTHSTSKHSPENQGLKELIFQFPSALRLFFKYFPARVCSGSCYSKAHLFVILTEQFPKIQLRKHRLC